MATRRNVAAERSSAPREKWRMFSHKKYLKEVEENDKV